MIDSYDYDDSFVNGDCSYHDVTLSPNLNSSIFHLNIGSLIKKG